MRSGKILHRFDDKVGAAETTLTSSTVESSEEIIEGFGKIIRDAREKTQLPLMVIAERIKEKESYLHSIEHEQLMPTLEVARKLEKELNIKLIEKIQNAISTTVLPKKGFVEPTLADMIETKKKKEK